ncbi:esterase/lipase/thioesterase [Hyaloscypha variabilis F]|uniref:Esterase/lipase/thioesterase n=1 Tax=Hyaloscypha variabilis (strain UAMH 11265 / GT02V1 / F) TaxID=1149755 RepID=A0A2J6RGB3_HYAVF|nr:esterase/lipase/thioesterase [Hyaloscypha variabilis F]
MTKSDITFDPSLFDPSTVPQATSQINAYLIAKSLSAPKGQQWWDIGAGEFRRLQLEGKTSWPAPTYRAPNGSYIQIKSRDNYREIKCRLIPPPSLKPDGVFYYIHGGGHVLAHCDWSDELLEAISKATNLTVISPEYRLAPEHPYPRGSQDVFDVAEYLVDNSLTIYGGPLKFIGGESAGSLLSMLTFLHLVESRPTFSFQGATFIYGLFDWSFSPSCNDWSTPLIMKNENVKRFGEAYLGDRSMEQRRNPAISPIYHPLFRYPGSQIASLEDLKTETQKKRPKLPPALFLCGTLDPVIDDTILMSFKWQVAGGEALVKLIPGGPHGFQLFPLEQFEPVVIGRNILLDFLKEKL